LDQTPSMRLFARTPFRTPVASPFDPAVQCATPEAMIAQYCAHASFNELRRHLDELWASIAEEAELFDELGAQSLQRLELTETGNGMWHLDADLSEATGRLLEKYLQTSCPPPRADEADETGLLPPAANRHAEALHQLLAGYGSSPQAATRHGHTATLDLTVDIETLQGKDTGRLPLLEGAPISVARARLLACEAGVIPSVFNYATGEAVELGRALRLPNTALRRKLELEQPEGCAWTGCSRPVAWTEAHHIQHWSKVTDLRPTFALVKAYHRPNSPIIVMRTTKMSSHLQEFIQYEWRMSRSGPPGHAPLGSQHAGGVSLPPQDGQADTNPYLFGTIDIPPTASENIRANASRTSGSLSSRSSDAYLCGSISIVATPPEPLPTASEKRTRHRYARTAPSLFSRSSD
ncbi:DUF222 domain-containing protein, partial [Glycomyces algeriensis]